MAFKHYPPALFVLGLLAASNIAQAQTSAQSNRPPRGGSSRGDPLIQAFDGTLFFFHGEPGKIYNFASIADGFQVSALLKEANNAVHTGLDRNGTYIEAIGFEQENVQVVVRTYAHDSSKIVGGREPSLKAGGAVSVSVSHYQKGEGTVVTISSPLVAVSGKLVPPGLDHAQYWQPSYLNIDLSLAKPPTGAFQGVIGNTYHHTGKGLSASSVDTPEKTVEVPPYSDIVYPLLPDAAYELPTLFAKPAMSFTAELLHDMIVTRKSALANLQARSAFSK